MPTVSVEAKKRQRERASASRKARRLSDPVWAEAERKRARYNYERKREFKKCPILHPPKPKPVKVYIRRLCGWRECVNIFEPKGSRTVNCSKECGKRSDKQKYRESEAGRLYQYNRKHAMRAMMQAADVDVTAKGKRDILDKYGGSCVYCGVLVAGGLEWDHETPIARGGKHMLANLVPSCVWCNRSKSSKALSVWLVDEGCTSPPL